MDKGGLFITLYDKDTLKLYLEQGVYGQHMTPQEGEPSSQSAHYKTLADYASTREGKHVFFFLDREIYYGGQIVGSDEHGAFYINGKKSPLGREADAPLVWDESSRDKYGETDEPGVFDAGGERGEKCQPFLIQFEDNQDMAGRYIISDQLYFELGEYPYPLPSNSIAGMGFCTITPAETDILLNLLENEHEGEIEPVSDEPVELQGDPIPFSPEYGVDSSEEAHPEAHLEASLIANPELLPEHMRPEGATICRQVPISPFKPSNLDQADVCYFSGDTIQDGTIPNTILELKIRKAGKGAALQVKRYLMWLHDRLGEEAGQIEIYVYAPGFTSTFDGYISERFLEQVEKVDYTEGSKQ
ncbi:hypothetical protein ACH9L7_14860 [Haloferax sp. S1W]|uniref:hypothetical protein n=1 Tax=Haloferax sp. S1W TaxID=3377110 RepID=UPI0037CBD5D6